MKKVNLLLGDNSFESGINTWFYAQTTAVPERTDKDAFDGKYSLILKGEAMFSRYHFHVIEAGKTYSYSFYAKGDGKTSVSACSYDGWMGMGNVIVTPSDKWERYGYTIGPFPTDHNIWFVIAPVGEGSILLDCFQLEEGEKPTQFRHSSPISAHMRTASPDNVYVPSDGALKLLVNFRMDNTLPLEYSAKVEIKRYPDAEPFVTKTLRITPDEYGLSENTLLLPEAQATGYYTATVKLYSEDKELLTEKSAAFISTLDLPQDFDRDFFGIHSSRVNVEAQRRIGVGWVRFAAPAWSGIEREKGVFDPFNSPVWHEMGIKRLTGIVGISSPPAWAKKNGTLPCCGEEVEAFAQYVIDNLDSDTDCYELENEPDLTMVPFHNVNIKTGVESFSEMARAIGKVVHRNGGKLMLNTSSASNDALAFADKVFQRCADSLDIFGPHLYACPRYIGPRKTDVSSPEDANFKGQIITCLEMANNYGLENELWIGEYGYALDYEEPYDSFYAGLHAACIVRSYLLAKTVPEFKRIFYFTDYYTVEDRYDYGLWRDDLQPLAAAAAHAVCARMIGGSTAQPILEGPDYYLIAYKSANQTVMAIWNGSNEATFESHNIVISADGIIATNMTGTVLEAENGKLSLDISPFPIYLSFDLSITDKVITDLTDELIRIQAFSLAVTRIAPQKFTVTLNPSDLLQKQFNDTLTFSINGCTVKKDIIVIPENSSEFDVCFEEKMPLSSLSIEISSEMTGQKFIRKSPALIVCKKDIIGAIENVNLDTFDNCIILRDRSDIAPPDPGIGWNGPDDLSAKLVCSWDDENLYVFADVTDNIHYQKHNDINIYGGDCLQFGIDLGNDGQPTGYDNKNDFEFGIALSNGETVNWCWFAPFENMVGKISLPSTVVRTENQTVYRVAIPWKLMGYTPETGNIFGMSISVNDDDGSGVRYHLQTSPGVNGIKRPDRFSKILLTE